MRAELRPGAAVAYEGDDYDVEALDGPLVRLRRRGPERGAVVVAVEHLLTAPGYRLLDVEPTSAAVLGDPAAELLPDAHRARAEARLAHLHEARSGYRAGHAAEALPGEPRPGDVARLREVRRQKGEEMADVREALTHWRAGYVDRAVNLLDHNGRVFVAANRDEPMTTVVDDWYGDRLRRQDRPDLPRSSMMTERHSERRELNALARARLIDDGTLGGPVLRAGELEFQAGDEVMALEQDRHLRPKGGTKRGDFVHTAERGTVVEVNLPEGRRDPGSLVVDFDRRGSVVVPMEYLTRPLDRGIHGVGPQLRAHDLRGARRLLRRGPPRRHRRVQRQGHLRCRHSRNT